MPNPDSEFPIRDPHRPAFGAGAVGALGMTSVLGGGRLIGVSSLNLELILGSFVTRASGPATWILGLILHLVVGGLWGVGYGFVIRALREGGALVGLGIGFVHWLLAGLLIGLVQFVHPVLPGVLPVPGYFATYLALGDVLIFCLAHLLFGAIVGALTTPGMTSQQIETSESKEIFSTPQEVA